MRLKIENKMKVRPQLTVVLGWVESEVIDVEQNPFLGLVISIKDRSERLDCKYMMC